jgi:hypothetical protein
MKFGAQVSGIMVCLLALNNVAAMAQPLIIDNFESGAIAESQFPVGTIEDDTADNVGIFGGQAGLPATNGAFGHRYVAANLIAGTQAGVLLNPSAGDSVDDAVRFRVASNSSANFILGYGGNMVI